MTEELVTFPTAKLAKEEGFDEECMHYFEWYEAPDGLMIPIAYAKPIFDFREVDKGVLEQALTRPALYNQVYHPMRNSTAKPWIYARPTQDLLERWLREVHWWFIGQVPVYDKGKCIGYLAADPWNITGDPKVASYSNATIYTTFELAREAALLHALKLIS